MKSIFLYLSILFLFLCSSCTEENLKTNNIEKVSILKDESFKIENVINKEFESIYNSRISYKNGVYWFKIVLNKKVTTLNKIIFQVQEPSVSSLLTYNSTKLLRTSILEKGNTTIISFINNPKETIYYLKANFKRQVHFPIKVFSENEYKINLEKKNLSIGFFYGFAIMVIIINLIFYISLKDVTFLLYSAFLTCINFVYTGFDGVLTLFFEPVTIDYFIIGIHFIIQVFGFLFASKFLNLNQYYPKINIIGFFLLLFPFAIYTIYFTNNNFLFCAIADFLGVLILCFCWVLGILMIPKEEYAKFFVVGYSLALFALIFYLVPLNFGISTTTVSFNQLKFGTIFEMLVLTYAITYKVKKIHQENINYRNELKSYLNEIYGLKKELELKKNNKIENILSEKVYALKENFNLTDREVDILLKITEGFSNNEIAEKLFISINTVKYHIKNLYEKLDIKKRTEISSKIIFDK